MKLPKYTGESWTWVHYTIMILLVVLALVVRMNYSHQQEFDSFWVDGMSESINQFGYAKWVLHPVALFGLYPLSYPSSTFYYLSTLSALTGLDMNHTILLNALSLSLFGILGMVALSYLISRRFLFVFFSTLFFAVSPYFVSYTSWNGSTRVMLLVFVPLYLWSLIKSRVSYKFVAKYVLLVMLLTVYLFMTHRMAQLLAITLVAFILAYGYSYWSFIKAWLHKSSVSNVFASKDTEARAVLFTLFLLFTQMKFSGLLKLIYLAVMVVLYLLVTHYQKGFKFLEKFPYKSYHGYFIFVPAFFIVFIAKLVDLAMRGRLLVNLSRLGEMLISKWVILLLVFIVAVIFALFLIPRKVLRWKRLLLSNLKRGDTLIRVLVLLGFLFLFLKQFTGNTLYNPDFGDWYEGSFFAGTNPVIIALNLFINYITTVNPLFPLFFVTVAYLIFKKKRSFIESFILLTILGYTSFLIDKRYVRMLIIPYMAVAISMSVSIISRFISRRSSKKWAAGLFIALSVLLPIFMVNFHLHRVSILANAEEVNPFYDYYWATGQFFKNHKEGSGLYSLMTSRQQLSGLTIYASSGIPAPPHSIFYYASHYLKPESKNLSTQKRKFFQSKGLNPFEQKDWYFNGVYYVGRHGKHFLNHNINDPVSQQMMKDYRIKYYVKDFMQADDALYLSIFDRKNVIYSNPNVNAFDLNRGRV